MSGEIVQIPGTDTVKFNAVEERLITLRGEKVLLDSDVAKLYGVQTKEVNQAIKNNANRFPDNYVVTLTPVEWKNLKSKISTSRDDALRSKFLTLEEAGRGKHRKYIPKAFTEKGLYMLATILKGERAVQTTIAIVEAFARIRELARTVAELPLAMKDEARQKSLIQKSNEIIGDILTNDLQVSSSETKYELNIATLFKITHTVTKTKKQ
jgi:phage regulator Rha-like protein